MGWFWTASAPGSGDKPAEALPQPSKAAANPAVCPVDHTTRQAWLDKAKAQRESEPASLATITTGESCDSFRMDTGIRTHCPIPGSKLGTHREISTIPRSLPEGHPPFGLANNEQETGADQSSGNWIYPSEEMFFNAMRRKNYDPKVADMRTIVPIHNAVNERAWKEIKEWEKGRGSDACGGPKLVSFSGQASALTPKARFNTLLGYQPPFDRHDWIIDRCGQKIEYVIDFYSGKDEKRPGKSLNFYLDVRPKLNTWEGCRMRLERLVGL